MHPKLIVRFVHVPPDGAALGWHAVARSRRRSPRLSRPGDPMAIFQTA
jgi:hypothetical protein